MSDESTGDYRYLRAQSAMTPNPVPSIPSREAVDLDVELRKAETIFRSADRAEYADGIKYAREATKPYRDAVLAEVERLTKTLPCGHHVSLLLSSAETGKPLYCDLCDTREQRDDAVRCETELRATVAAQAAALQSIKDDCEHCDWTCVTCGADYRMKETDLYGAALAALASQRSVPQEPT